MSETNDQPQSSLIDQFRSVIRDGIDYGASVLRLLQAQLTQIALSGFLFIILILFSAFAGIAAFLLLSVALGIWLAHLLGSAGYSLLVMGGFYLLIMVVLGGVSIRWLKNLKD